MDWTHLIIFAVALAGSYFGSYMRKKGENRAIREDLDGMNRKLENIKSEFVESHAYAAEKGKGLATKEDIGEVTRTVEQVKSNVAMSLELIKLELGKKATIHRLAAEKEFEALTEIGGFLYELQLATMGLRPLGIQRIPPNETEEQKQEKYQRRYDEWAKGHDAFMDSVEKNKLFLPYDLYYSSSTLDDCPLTKPAISEPLLLLARVSSLRELSSKLRRTSLKCRKRSTKR